MKPLEFHTSLWMSGTPQDGSNNPFLSILLWGVGDISFTSNDAQFCDQFEGWTCESYPALAPRSFEDCLSKDFSDWLKLCAENQAVMALAATAFPAEAVEELAPDQDEPFDSIENEDDIARVEPGEESIQQDTELDEVDVPGLPVLEAERRQGWKKLPQRVRVAVRRLAASLATYHQRSWQISSGRLG